MKHKRVGRRQGFTIVELLIVIVVIAILAAVTVVSYNGIKARTEETVISNDISSVIKQLETQKTEQLDSYPLNDSKVQVSQGSSLQYTQLNSGSSYCATVTRGSIAYFTTQGFKNLVGSCPGQTTIQAAPYMLTPPDWTASQIPTVLNGSVATTMAGSPVTISSSLSSGSSTGTHIDGNSSGTLTMRYCWPITNLDGTPCPSTLVPDMQVTSGRTLTVNLDVVPDTYNSLSFVMSDVENTNVTVRAYDAASVQLASTSWQVSSQDRSFDGAAGYYIGVSPASNPNPYVNSGTGITLSAATGQDDDSMRVAFDPLTLTKLQRVTVSFASASTGDWTQWNFYGRHK